ncbi:N-acetyltransferase B complex non catalytic subunit-domain-containing protein [Xylaria cubensis]|nr:N-acetyltransferase B complex non catalytic subunit-domain-containing protein [Xylaria cubensis]
MAPPRIAPAPRSVQLKHTVDLQLDRAFHDEQWAIAANLARNRHNATKDEYYKAVEIAAKSRCDNAADRTLGGEVVQTMINDNTVIKDIDALDLYEFSIICRPMNYAKTIGVLRSRLVKALPKDQNVGVKCLEACMWYSDWENAQEIAVSLNRNFPGDRRFLFHNILTTFLVAIDDSTNEIKKKLFPNLAKAQVDRAFNLRPLTGKEQTIPDLTQITHDEVLLWLQIRQRFGSAQENLMLLSLPNWGPLLFLERGFTEAFFQSIQLLSFNEQWEEIIKVTDTVFDKVISLGQEEPPASSLAMNDRYTKASREWLLWTSSVNAAKKLPNGQETLKIFHKKIKKVIRVLNAFDLMNPVFQKNYDMILLDIAFHRALIATTSPHKFEHNVVPHLLELAKKHADASSCFMTLKGFLELLDQTKIAEFVDDLGSEHTEDVEGVDTFDKLVLLALRLKVRLFQATSLTANERCGFCQSMISKGPDCETCLKSITACALDGFRAGVQDTDVSEKAAHQSEDPLLNLAILGSICLIKLAGAGHKSWQHRKESPLYHINIQLFLQAVIWLDFCFRRRPKNDSLDLLLVRLYLLMGCVTQALKIFGRSGIKATLLESLGMVCYDRLASISPGHFVQKMGQDRTFMDNFRRYFETAVGKRYPDCVRVSLENSIYAGVPRLVELAHMQSHNCALVLTVVEIHRGLRVKTGRNETTMDEEPLIAQLPPNYELRDRTDYDSLPQWTGPQSMPIQELTSYGPLPTNRRCHLGILTERFFDLVCYTQPKDFKPSKATQLLQVDWQAAASSCRFLHTSLDALLFGDNDDIQKYVTGPESWHFRIVSQLAKLVGQVLETVLLSPPAAAASTKATREDVVHTIHRALKLMEYQSQDFLALPRGIHARMHTLHGVAATHAMGMFRDSALAARHAVQFLGAALDRIKTTDKPRGTAEAAWLTPETRKLVAAATAADASMKERIRVLTDGLNASGWVDCLLGWVFGGDDDDDDDGDDDIAGQDGFGGIVAKKMDLFIPADVREEWAADVTDSWRDVVKGWRDVRFD